MSVAEGMIFTSGRLRSAALKLPCASAAVGIAGIWTLVLTGG